MQIKKKPTAWLLFAAYVFWTVIGAPIWNLNVENVAAKNNLDKALSEGLSMTWLSDLLTYLPSSFFAGFVVGGLIFAYWENIAAVIRHGGIGKADVAEMRAWVGSMQPAFDRAARRFSIFVDIIAVGNTPIRIAAVEGEISVIADNGNGRRVAYTFSNPRFKSPPSDDFVRRGWALHCEVDLDMAPEFANNMYDVFVWKPHPIIEFESLAIELEDPKGHRKRLQLWDSLRVSTGDQHIRFVQTVNVPPEIKEATTAMISSITKLLPKLGKLNS